MLTHYTDHSITALQNGEIVATSNFKFIHAGHRETKQKIKLDKKLLAIYMVIVGNSSTAHCSISIPEAGKGWGTD